METIKNSIKIADGYRISSDGKMNLILHEKYEKASGRGKNAKLTGEFDYRQIGYFQKLSHIGDYLVDLEIIKYQGNELGEAIEKVEKIRDEIQQTLSENIGVKWLD